MSEAEIRDLYPLVEQAWGLSEAASNYVKNAGREVPLQEVVDKVFLPSGLVDVQKTQKESGNPPKIFLKSIYGLEYRPANNNWIPIRHGALPS